VDGHIGYQMTGRVPIREVWERGYRPGWDPAHQWQGLVPFEGLPRLADPERGWIVTANHRPAPDDFPYPLSGTWSDDFRARRIRDMIEVKGQLARDDFAVMHQDTLSLRAVRCVPKLLEVLSSKPDQRVQQACAFLAEWDCRFETDRVGASIFEVFFSKWCEVVTAERFDGDDAELLVTGINGLAVKLLAEGDVGWFRESNRDGAILTALRSALDFLSGRLGQDISGWAWGKLHTLPLTHVLSIRGELGQLLDHGGSPAPGSAATVCNTGTNPDLTVRSGAVYRLIADLSSSPPGLWAVDAQSQSGHPGSPHYRDQLTDWLAGRYHYLPLDRTEVSRGAVALLALRTRT
jgi:penicillin amidase